MRVSQPLWGGGPALARLIRALTFLNRLAARKLVAFLEHAEPLYTLPALAGRVDDPLWSHPCEERLISFDVYEGTVQGGCSRHWIAGEICGAAGAKRFKAQPRPD